MATNEKILADIQRVEKARGTPDEAYFNKNYGGIDAYIANQQARMTQPTNQGVIPSQGFDHTAELANMEKYLQEASDGYLKQQQAALESNLTAQISELQAAYQQAVADGQISVRDAEAQFEEQVKQIQQQAYLDAERTALYGQEMGIQNSQQMVGLMQGDMARKQSLMQEGMSERDKRINDIKDRMNAIKSQKDISIARAQADYRSALLGAEGEAQRMYNEGMFGLMRDDYGARRDQSFTQENLRLQDELTRGQMRLQHGFDLERDAKQSYLRIQEIDYSHGLDLQKMSVEFDYLMQQLAAQHGYSMQQINAQGANQLAAIKAQFINQMSLIEKERQMEEEKIKAYLDDSSIWSRYSAKEREQARKDLEWELGVRTKAAVQEVFSQSAAKTIMQEIFESPYLPARGAELETPKDYRHAWGNLLGSMGNWYHYGTGGLEDKLDVLEKNKEASRLMDEFLKQAGIGPDITPWSTIKSPEFNAIERFLQRTFPNTPGIVSD